MPEVDVGSSRVETELDNEGLVLLDGALEFLYQFFFGNDLRRPPADRLPLRLEIPD